MNDKITVDCTDLKHDKRLAILSDELVKMKNKKQIIDEYSKKWNLTPATIRHMLMETYVWLATKDKVNREQMQVLNAERLDNLFTEAENLSDKLKIINLLNKTYSVYDNNINISNKEGTEFKFDVGV